MVALNDVFKDGTIIKISENKKTRKFRCFQVGIDPIGKYRKIVTPQGVVEKVYHLKAETVKELLTDRYNRLHQYRREGDSVVVYYNKDTKDIAVLAVKPNDDLSTYPFNLKDAFVVTQKMLDEDRVTPRKGIVSISKENLEKLQEEGFLSEEAVYVLLYNKNNVGFYL